MTAQEQVEYGTRKLAHYNAWLLDTKRPFGVAYPGFPEDLEAPKAAKRVTKVTDKVTKKGKVAVKAKRASKGETKLDQAKALFKANGFKGREFMVALFMTELNMTKAGATTYWYSAKK
jgi:hypothetical protein